MRTYGTYKHKYSKISCCFICMLVNWVPTYVGCSVSLLVLRILQQYHRYRVYYIRSKIICSFIYVLEDLVPSYVRTLIELLSLILASLVSKSGSYVCRYNSGLLLYVQIPKSIVNLSSVHSYVDTYVFIKIFYNLSLHLNRLRAYVRT